MRQVSAHLPQDQRLSLAQGATLPSRACGLALFADISGLTALTVTLVQWYAMRQFTEELRTCLRYGLTDMKTYALVAPGSFPEAQATFRQVIDIRRSHCRGWLSPDSSMCFPLKPPTSLSFRTQVPTNRAILRAAKKSGLPWYIYAPPCASSAV